MTTHRNAGIKTLFIFVIILAAAVALIGCSENYTTPPPTRVPVTVYDTTLVPVVVYDTSRVPISIYDTTRVPVTVYDTTHVPVTVYDTTRKAVTVYDTTRKAVTIYDTTHVPVVVYDTTTVPAPAATMIYATRIDVRDPQPYQTACRPDIPHDFIVGNTTVGRDSLVLDFGDERRAFDWTTELGAESVILNERDPATDTFIWSIDNPWTHHAQEIHRIPLGWIGRPDTEIRVYFVGPANPK